MSEDVHSAMSQAATRPGTSPTPHGENSLLPGGILDLGDVAEDSWTAFARQTNYGKNMPSASSAFAATQDDSRLANLAGLAGFLSSPGPNNSPAAVRNVALPAIPSTPGSLWAPPSGVSGLWEGSSPPRGSAAIGGDVISPKTAASSNARQVGAPPIGSGATGSFGVSASTMPTAFADVPAGPLLSPFTPSCPQVGCAPSPLAGPLGDSRSSPLSTPLSSVDAWQGDLDISGVEAAIGSMELPDFFDAEELLSPDGTAAAKAKAAALEGLPSDGDDEELVLGSDGVYVSVPSTPVRNSKVVPGQETIITPAFGAEWDPAADGIISNVGLDGVNDKVKSLLRGAAAVAGELPPLPSPSTATSEQGISRIASEVSIYKTASEGDLTSNPRSEPASPIVASMPSGEAR